MKVNGHSFYDHIYKKWLLQPRPALPTVQSSSIINTALAIPPRDQILHHHHLVLAPDNVTDQLPILISLARPPPKKSVAWNTADSRVLGFLRSCSQVLLDLRTVRLG